MRSDGPHLESQYSKRNEIEMDVEEQMKIAIPVSSLSNHNEYSALIVSFNTHREEMATWKYVTIVLIDEQKRLQ